MEQNKQIHEKTALKDNTRRAKRAVFMIWVILVLDVAMGIFYIRKYSLLQQILDGSMLPDDIWVDAYDMLEGILALLYLLAVLISGITFIMWFRRAYYNLHQIKDDLSYSEGWAAGAWFVPILNLFRPYQIMKELYEKTKEYLVEKKRIHPDALSLEWVGWWWALLIISSIVDRIIFKLPQDSLEDLLTESVWQIISAVIGVVSAWITIKVIKAYADVEPLLQEKESSGPNEILYPSNER